MSYDENLKFLRENANQLTPEELQLARSVGILLEEKENQHQNEALCSVSA